MLTIVVVQCHLVAKEHGPCWSSNDGGWSGDAQPFIDAGDSISVQSLVNSRVYASFVVSLRWW